MRALFQKIYDGVALFAVLQLLSLVGLVAMLAISGALSMDKMRSMVAVMRGASLAQIDSATSNSAQPSPSALPTAATAASTATTGDPIVDTEILRRETERARVELDQQLALVNSVLVKAATEKEAAAQERQLIVQQKESPLQANREEGFRRQLELFEQLSPKVAVQHLLAMGDTHEAARLLAGMEPRKARKIVEAAKTPQQLQQMQTVLAQVQEVAPPPESKSDTEEP